MFIFNVQLAFKYVNGYSFFMKNTIIDQEKQGVTIVKDIVHGSIILTELERYILRHYLLDRLQNVKQQSLVYRVYPGATHTRLAHSIGTMFYASKMFHFAMANSSDNLTREYVYSKLNSLLIYLHHDKNKIKYIENIFNMHNYKYCNANNLTLNSHSRMLKSINRRPGIEYIIKSSILYFVGKPFVKYISGNYSDYNLFYIFILLLVRIKALLHDVGHLPFSHITEYALVDYKTKLHESISQKISRIIIIDSIKQLYDEACSRKMNTIEKENIMIMGILLVYAYDNFENIFFDLNLGLIDTKGGIDADRVDYVLRDGMHSSMFPTSGDTERIYKTYKLSCVNKDRLEEEDLIGYYDYYNNHINILASKRQAVQEKDRNKYSSYYSFPICINKYFFFLPSAHSYNDVIEVLYDRYRIYKYVNNHHRSKRIDGMLERSLKIIFNYNIDNINNNILINNTNIKNIILEIQNMKYVIKELLPISDITNIYNYRDIISAFSKYDDAWLITNLKNLYIELKRQSDEINEQYVSCKSKRNRQKKCKTYISLRLLLLHLSEIFAERSYISIWKRESDYIYTINQVINSNPKWKRRIVEKLCKRYNIQCYKITNKVLINVFKILKINIREKINLQRKISGCIQKNMLKKGHYRRYDDVIAIYNYNKPGVNSQYPILFADFRRDYINNIHLLSEFSKTIESIQQDEELLFPYHVYALTADSSVGQDVIAENAISAVMGCMIKIILDEVADKEVAAISDASLQALIKK